ncbi:MAG: hypothetical protein ACREOZ_02865, partial [Gloeomargaritales cyanobacterium]
MLCCSTTYSVVRFRLHTKDDSDNADGIHHIMNINNDHAEETNQNDNVAINGRDEIDHNSDTDNGSTQRNDRSSSNATANMNNSKKGTGVINSLVLDMCRPLEHKGRVVNFDNYYGSPTVLMQLRLRNVMARCTVRQNRRFLPQLMLWSQWEARGMERGATKMLINDEHKMVAFG